jgi:hypothetical protein
MPTDPQSPEAQKKFLRAYETYQRASPVTLVEQVLRLHKVPDPSTHFAEDTWLLFKYSVEFRHFIVHECTYLGQDKSPSLHQATEEVLRELKKLGGLR